MLAVFRWEKWNSHCHGYDFGEAGLGPTERFKLQSQLCWYVPQVSDRCTQLHLNGNPTFRTVSSSEGALKGIYPEVYGKNIASFQRRCAELWFTFCCFMTISTCLNCLSNKSPRGGNSELLSSFCLYLATTCTDPDHTLTLVVWVEGWCEEQGVGTSRGWEVAMMVAWPRSRFNRRHRVSVTVSTITSTRCQR